MAQKRINYANVTVGERYKVRFSKTGDVFGSMETLEEAKQLLEQYAQDDYKLKLYTTLEQSLATYEIYDADEHKIINI